ncbi:metallophosphoesterase family protein [Leptospira sp. GIMC2001]|uniref:metallophosphoesterase family protein n=1 Tax=Leptospira sp. GIMC2001 TaxID=1513297 RepID=UPI00300E1BAA
MKIIYLTDIHDGLQGLKTILTETEADLYLFSGDIIYKAFFSDDRIIDFCGLQEEFYGYLTGNLADLKPYDFATRVIRFPNKYTPEQVKKAYLYRDLFQLAAKTMKEKYGLIEALIQKYGKSQVFALPGNYDIDLQYTALYERDLHRKSFDFKGFKLSGYGGAPIATSGIPEKLAVVFHEYIRNGKNYSEPEEFFEEEKPDICVIHNPAFGYFDKIPGVGNVGSQGIRRYLDDYDPILVVSGHVHEDQGVQRKKNTVFVNPSNFGAVDSIAGFQHGGYYAEIFIENRRVQNVNLMRVIDKKPFKLIEVVNEEHGLEITKTYDENDVDPAAFVRK